MTPTYYGPRVRITTRNTDKDTQPYEIVQERVNDRWVDKGAFGHMSDDFAFTNAGALARGLAAKYLGTH